MPSDIKTIAITDNQYPSLLKQINDPPKTLYYRGDISIAHQQHIIAIVGSRKINTYGNQALKKIAEPLPSQNIIIVSGLAYGVDSLAHKICVSQKKPTIAVLGTGIDDASIYPSSNRTLANNIIATGGLLLSEYPPGTRGQKYHFPARNRIIAGLSTLTIVVQARKKSGSLITSRLATEYNRDVGVVPGPITDPLSEGTNHLLTQGAYPILESTNITELLGIEQIENQPTLPLQNFTPDQEKILQLLSNEPIHTSHIIEKSQIPIHQLNVILTELELIGYIQNTGNMKYIKTSNT